MQRSLLRGDWSRGSRSGMRTSLAILLAAMVVPWLLASGAMASRTSLLAARLPAGAIAKLGRADWSETSPYGDEDWAAPDPIYYDTGDSGDLSIVTPDSSAGTLHIDTYDPATLRRVGSRRSISLAGWPDWGGFYAGPDGCFYVLVGRGNDDEDDSRDVVAVRRYDAGWNLLGTAYVQGGATQGGIKGIYSPFDAGDPHMVLVGNLLVVHMSRLIYAIEGIHHQTNLTFEVDVDSMTATPFDELGSCAYCSHSFQQLVAMNGGDLVTVDHGDAYPRSIQMGVMAGYPDQRDVSTYDLFQFNGAIGNNYTGATVDDLVSGPSGIVVVGTSIPQPDAPKGRLGSWNERRNVYAIWADPSTGAHRLRWLTSYAPHGASNALEPRVVPIGADRYAVLFSVEGKGGYSMKYRLIDSAGSVLARGSFGGMYFCAASDPILIDSKIYWVGIGAAASTSDYLFALNVSSPTAPRLVGRS